MAHRSRTTRLRNVNTQTGDGVRLGQPRRRRPLPVRVSGVQRGGGVRSVGALPSPRRIAAPVAAVNVPSLESVRTPGRLPRRAVGLRPPSRGIALPRGLTPDTLESVRTAGRLPRRDGTAFDLPRRGRVRMVESQPRRLPRRDGSRRTISR